MVGIGSEVTTHQIGDKIAVECIWRVGTVIDVMKATHICENGKIFGVHTDGAFAPYFTIPAVNARRYPLIFP